MMASVHSRVMSPRRENPPNEVTYAGRLGAAVKARRKKLGISVAELADALGVSEATIYDWEKGRRTLDINYMPAIAFALKTSILRLFPAE
jgi:transcriptional regulator with XRE-family HTH domain